VPTQQSGDASEGGLPPRLRRWILQGLGALLSVAAVGLAGLAWVLIRDGAWPEPGTGSLGHVGMVIAGAIGALLSLLCGLLAVSCWVRSRRHSRP
jgi:hypothetical protein